MKNMTKYTSENWTTDDVNQNTIFKKTVSVQEGDKTEDFCIIRFEISKPLKYGSVSENQDLIKNKTPDLKSNFGKACLGGPLLVGEFLVSSLSDRKIDDLIKVTITLKDTQSYIFPCVFGNKRLHPIDPLASYDLYRIMCQNDVCEISFADEQDRAVKFVVENSDHQALCSFTINMKS